MDQKLVKDKIKSAQISLHKQTKQWVIYIKNSIIEYLKIQSL